MANENKTNLSEEYLRKFKHRYDYRISESPKYRPLVTDSEEFDEMPVLTNEAGEQEDAEKQGQVPPAPSNDQPQNTDAPETPVPSFDAEAGDVPPEGMTDPMSEPTDGMPPADPMTDPMGAPEAPDTEVDELQNEIIKHNIEAMKAIQDELAGISSVIQGLNSKMDVLSADVEEVREPTDSEKLMNKTDVSYPYYFNLNDFWKDNWFDQKRAQESENGGGREVEQGIKELPDGTFVADFDDLPQKSKVDIQNSFNDI